MPKPVHHPAGGESHRPLSSHHRRGLRFTTGASLRLAALMLLAAGCRGLLTQTDRDVEAQISRTQRSALGRETPLRLGPASRPSLSDDAYRSSPGQREDAPPPGFASPASRPATGGPVSASVPAGVASSPATQPGAPWLTLASALEFAQRNRREYQTEKENLYVAALDLTLEQHLWTPIFSADLRTVYGNYGEAQNFDQAMRFVADLGVTQRLPYGGEFSARMLSNLVRDVKKSITAEEGGQTTLGLEIPFLRNAGHVAREELLQLQRSLVYAVRVFERFRRRQLVEVSSAYFALLSAKQRVLDTQESVERLRDDYERARSLEAMQLGTNVETQRAETTLLSAEDRLERERERFRAQTDQFKLLIGMSIDVPISLANLQSIDEIEAEIEAARMPLLARPDGADDEFLAQQVALARRLDLKNLRDQIDDARRGTRNAENQLLPDLNLNTTASFDTDPLHYRVTDYEFNRVFWRSELVLSLPVDRFRERNAYRRAMLDVRRAERVALAAQESIRAEVRAAVNDIRLADKTLLINRRAVEVADNRRELTRLLWEDGKIENRDKLEAESEWTSARNQLNDAKTALWVAVLELRLATETLTVEEPADAPSPANP